MKRYIVLILLLMPGLLPAMDPTEQDAQRRATLLADRAKTQKELETVRAQKSFMQAIVGERPDDAKAIFDNTPHIILEKPTANTDWVDTVLSHAQINSQNPDIAKQFDDLAICIVQYMITLNLYDPDQSHLLIACKYNRYLVVQTLLYDIKYEMNFKGKGIESAYEWAQFHNSNSFPCAKLILYRAQQLEQERVSAAQHAQWQQQVAAQQAQWNQQYGVSPALDQQFQNQQPQRQTSTSSSSSDGPIPLPKLDDTRPRSTPFWRKVLVVAVIAYGCKKLWDWYFYEEPTQTEHEEPEDEWNSDTSVHTQ